MFDIHVYYQNFSLNAGVFNPNHLVINETTSTHITKLNVACLKELGYEFEDGCDNEKYSQAIFEMLNIRHDELNVPERCFKSAGHTSMSVGDFILYRPLDVREKFEVHICASAGWRVIDDWVDYLNAYNNSIRKLQNLPVGFYLAMNEKLKDDSLDLNYLISSVGEKRCENHCPKCDATDPDIDWAYKDVQDFTIYQNAHCKKCGCDFTEEYSYTRTVIDEKVEDVKDAK